MIQEFGTTLVGRLNGNRNLVLGTSEVFSGTVASVMGGRELVLADFSGDDGLEMFFADQGREAGQ